MTQKERQERSRREILQAALEEFGTHGYSKVTMEAICSRHKISKGMMYHYYANKDELFLLCVQDTFHALQAYVEENVGKMAEAPMDRLKQFFLVRECFFQSNPQRKMIFEDAVFHPPQHLAAELQRLHQPMQALNQKFFLDMLPQVALRPELGVHKVIRYLECVWDSFRSAAAVYLAEPAADMQVVLRGAGEFLDMALFGVLRYEPPTEKDTVDSLEIIFKRLKEGEM